MKNRKRKPRKQRQPKAAVNQKPKSITHHHRGIILIAVFKLFKATLLVAAAIGAFSLLHRDVADTMMNLLDTLHVDHNNNFLHSIVMKLGVLDDHKLRQIGAGSFFYAAVLGTEGVGLLLEKRWAEYLTVIATALLIPLEIYELAKHASVGKIIVLIINIAMVVYLIYRLKRDVQPKHAPQASAKASG